MSFELIAFDMDGTLLDSSKQIRPSSKKAMEEAVAAGKTIALCTGRAPSELKDFKPLLPEVHYWICLSGAIIYDVKQDLVLKEVSIPVEIVNRLFDIADQEEAMVHILSEQTYADASCICRMADFGMGVYQKMFEKDCCAVKDLRSWYQAAPFCPSKLNIYHHNTDDRERTVARIAEAKLPVSTSYSEQTSYECSPSGIDKGVGLTYLCEVLGIHIEQAIAVGDADNDIPALKAAGLAVVMGNAKDHIKELADVVVEDCDHNGCAQAIAILMGKEKWERGKNNA